MANDEGRRRLAEAVRTRRAQLKLAQEDLAQRGGPGDLTIRKIERCADTKYQARTMFQLEKALKWKNGYVRALLEGTAEPNSTDWQLDEKPKKSILDRIAAVHGTTAVGVVGTARATAEDTARASDTATANATTAEGHGEADQLERLIYRNPDTGAELAGAVFPSTGDVSIIARAGLDFLDLVQQHRDNDPAAGALRHAVLSYIQHILIQELNGNSEVD